MSAPRWLVAIVPHCVWHQFACHRTTDLQVSSACRQRRLVRITHAGRSSASFAFASVVCASPRVSLSSSRRADGGEALTRCPLASVSASEEEDVHERGCSSQRQRTRDTPHAQEGEGGRMEEKNVARRQLMSIKYTEVEGEQEWRGLRWCGGVDGLARRMLRVCRVRRQRWHRGP